MTQAFSTKHRILGAAEELFARHGFGSTSLRQITSHADVNIAAVNYHFGSKENLVEELFRRRMDQMSTDRRNALQKALSDKDVTLESVLRAYIEPALQMGRKHNGGHFVRILARAYAEQNDRLRKFLSENYGSVQRDFAKAIDQVRPGLSKEQMYLRLDFVAGALTYTLSEFGMVKRAAGVSEAQHLDKLTDTLISFCSAGFKS
ncbi:TetR/AcrR family transcriptional regulator [Luteimonas sp. FXH3W]|uniref:TetR/AcrR family transcriptional regulator n=1 Tax=Aquilutibacter rugosus TaxID=3115820 RepID=A0ABU7UZM4_9GAMM